MMETKGLSREKSFLHSRMTKKMKLFFLPGCFGTYICVIDRIKFFS